MWKSRCVHFNHPLHLKAVGCMVGQNWTWTRLQKNFLQRWPLAHIKVFLSSAFTRAESFEGGAVVFLHPVVAVLEQQADRCGSPVKLVYLESLNHLPVPSCEENMSESAWSEEKAENLISDTGDWTEAAVWELKANRQMLNPVQCCCEQFLLDDNEVCVLTCMISVSWLCMQES